MIRNIIRRKGFARRVLPLTIAILLGASPMVQAVTISSVNNTVPKNDYKLNRDKMKEKSEKIDKTADVKDESDKQNLNDLNDIISALISKNIISRQPNITWTGDTINPSNDGYDFNISNPNSKKDITKTEFMVMLSKALYGVEDSRTIKLPNGKIFVSANVTEEYLKKLLDKGIINKTEIENKQFLDDYDNYGKLNGSNREYPKWAEEEGATEPTQGVLGQSFAITSNSITYKPTKFFKDETITAYQALRLVEKSMRLTEKNMTHLEAEMIAYKYGVELVNMLTPECKQTVEFLIAKGVMNFEDKKEFIDLYASIDNSYVCKLLYRLNDKNARVDFSKIELTDNEKYWLNKGLYKGNITTRKCRAPQTKTYISVNGEEEKEIDDYLQKAPNADNIGNDWEKEPNQEDKNTWVASGNKKQTVHDGVNKYTITRVFRQGLDYFYRGEDVTKLDGKQVKDVKSSKKTKNEDTQVVFEVESTSEQLALATLNANTTFIDSEGDSESTNIPSVTKVKGNGKEITYIPESALEKLDSELTVIADKYVRNKVTGAEAVLLKDNKVAIVGNRVIHTDGDVMMLGLGNEQYYNLDVLNKLMSNTFVGDITGYDEYYYSGNITSREAWDVISSDTDNTIQKTFVNKASSVKEFDPLGRPIDEGATKDVLVYNSSQMTQASTELIMDFRVKDAVQDPKNKDQSTSSVTMIVDWQLVIPDSIYKGANLPSKKDLKLQDVKNLYFQKPDGVAGDWWESNIGLSNAIANYAFKSKGLDYFKTGYLMPTVTLLSFTKEPLTVSQINEIFANFDFSDSYKSHYVGGTENYAGYLFNVTAGNSELSKLQSLRTLVNYSKPTTGFEMSQYGPKFFISKSGNLYRTFASKNGDGKMESDISNPMIEKVNIDKKQIIMKSRFNQEEALDFKDTGDNAKVGNKIRFDDHMFVLTEGVGDGGNSNKDYYELTAQDPIQVVLTGDHDKPFTFKDNQYKDIEDCVKSSLLNGYQYMIGKGIEIPSYGQFGSNDRFVTWKSKGNHYANGYLVSPDGKQTPLMKDGDGGPEAKKGDEVDLYPTVFVSKDKFKFIQINKANDFFDLTADSKIPAHSFPSLYYRGLNQGMIDSIVAKNYGYSTTGQLPNGAKVLIGDIEFVQDNGSLVSKPINLNVSEFSDPATVKKPGGVLSKIFSGIQISNGLEMFETSTLPEYITDIGFGGKKECFPTEDKDNKPLYPNLLFDSGGTLMVDLDNGVTKYSSQAIQYYIMKLNLSGDLKFRKVDATNNVYALVYFSPSLGPGNMMENPLFGESLGPIDKGLLTTGLTRGVFSALANVDEIYAQNLNLLLLARMHRLFDILKILAMDLLSYLWVAVTTVYFLKKTHVGEDTLKSIKEGGEKRNGKGWDWFSKLTWGIMNLDDDVGVTKYVFVMLVLSSLVTFTWKWVELVV